MSAFRSPAARLDSLLVRHPIPPGLERPDLFTEVVVIAGLRVDVAGLAVDVDGVCVTGSAASVGDAPVDRAYYELLERLSALEARSRADFRFPVRDRYGTALGEIPAASLAPGAEPEGIRWARSNGVAIGYDFTGAARRARLELLERDAILRSFYGEGRPDLLLRATPQLGAELAGVFDVESYAFPSAGASVAGVFAFPKAEGPLVYGFGAETSMDAAVLAATRECVQRLAFLWDAELPGSPPAPAATPDFHQEFYLYRGHASRIREWLSGEHERFAGSFRVDPQISEPVFADITPPWLSGLSVAQALPSGHAPLCFGWGHPLLVNAPPALMVHPVA